MNETQATNKYPTSTCGQKSCSEEPNETPIEHATEHVIGREIHPLPERKPRFPNPPQFQERPLPRKLMSAAVPNLTNAKRMMDKKRVAPMIPEQKIMPTMNFMRFDVPTALPKKNHATDPFRNISGCEKRRKLPKGMEMFGQHRRKRKWSF